MKELSDIFLELIKKNEIDIANIEIEKKENNLIYYEDALSHENKAIDVNKNKLKLYEKKKKILEEMLSKKEEMGLYFNLIKTEMVIDEVKSDLQYHENLYEEEIGIIEGIKEDIQEDKEYYKMIGVDI